MSRCEPSRQQTFINTMQTVKHVLHIHIAILLLLWTNSTHVRYFLNKARWWWRRLIQTKVIKFRHTPAASGKENTASIFQLCIAKSGLSEVYGSNMDPLWVSEVTRSIHICGPFYVDVDYRGNFFSVMITLKVNKFKLKVIFNIKLLSATVSRIKWRRTPQISLPQLHPRGEVLTKTPAELIIFMVLLRSQEPGGLYSDRYGCPQRTNLKVYYLRIFLLTSLDFSENILLYTIK